MSKSYLRWYGDRVRTRVLDAASEEALKQVALQILAHAQVNIRDNGQIDTGFMLNSGYVVAKGFESYGEATASAKARAEDHSMKPKVALGKYDAATAFGAEYAIWQELSSSFLAKAGQQTAKDPGVQAKLTAAFKAKVHD